MCRSLTGFEVGYSGEEGMGMPSAASSEAEAPNGGIPERYTVDTSSLLCVAIVNNHQ